MTDTIYRHKVGVSEWSIHLWRNNGHDIYSRHEVVDSVPGLGQAQVAAATELRRLERADLLAGDGGSWWADLQHGTWHPIEHDVDGETVRDATWVASGRRYVGHPTSAGDVEWAEL